MKQIISLPLFAGILLSSLASGQDQPNMAIVSALTLARATTERVPAEASQNALHWDQVIFSQSRLADPDQAKASSGRRFLGGGIDFIARKYSTPVPFDTLQTHYYWLLKIPRTRIMNNNALSWVQQVLGLYNGTWRAEPSTEGWRVMRYVIAKIPVPGESWYEYRLYERNVWERSLRVLENESTLLVYVEKISSNHPKVFATDINSHEQWFNQSENPTNLIGQKIRYKWWQFWRW